MRSKIRAKTASGLGNNTSRREQEKVVLIRLANSILDLFLRVWSKPPYASTVSNQEPGFNREIAFTWWERRNWRRRECDWGSTSWEGLLARAISEKLNWPGTSRPATMSQLRSSRRTRLLLSRSPIRFLSFFYSLLDQWVFSNSQSFSLLINGFLSENKMNKILIWVLDSFFWKPWIFESRHWLSSMVIMAWQIKREIATLKLLKHPNVVRLHEVLFLCSFFFLFLLTANHFSIFFFFRTWIFCTIIF